MATAKTQKSTAVAKSVETVETAVDASSEVAKSAEDVVLKNVGTFLEFGRDNAATMIAVGNDFALGLQKMSLALIDWSAESCDKSVAGASAILSAKSVEEAMDLSQSLARDGLRRILKEGSEFGTLSARLVEDMFVPLPGRLVAAVEKLAAHAG